MRGSLLMLAACACTSGPAADGRDATPAITTADLAGRVSTPIADLAAAAIPDAAVALMADAAVAATPDAAMPSPDLRTLACNTLPVCGMAEFAGTPSQLVGCVGCVLGPGGVCGDRYQACAPGTDCDAFVQCTQACPQGDLQCTGTCQQFHQAGRMAWISLLTCLYCDPYVPNTCSHVCRTDPAAQSVMAQLCM